MSGETQMHHLDAAPNQFAARGHDPLVGALTSRR